MHDVIGIAEEEVLWEIHSAEQPLVPNNIPKEDNRKLENEQDLEQNLDQSVNNLKKKERKVQR